MKIVFGNIFLFVLFPAISSSLPDPIVSTEYGEIEGINYQTPKGFRAEVFLGIPFAEPPIGKLRFEKPLPPSPWASPLKAKSYGLPCATYTDAFYPKMSEDCLTLSIFKPEAPSPDPNGYTVMVFIHGGAFIIGSGVDFDYKEIVERVVSKGIILVTINYRLGPFGFFSTGNSDAPGNYGLWDQVEALKFIQKTIESFNGNPKSVTIFGVSAGGASVSWLSLSPETKDLFLRAIPMSGSAGALWASSEDVIDHSASLLNATQCSDNGGNAKECLKQKSLPEIYAAFSTYLKSPIQADDANLGIFHPRFDNDFVKATNMKDAIKKAPKKANFLGVCSQENAMFVIKSHLYDPSAKIMPISEEKAATFGREDFVEIIEKLVATEKVYGSRAKEAAERILEFYETQRHFYTKNFYFQLYTQLFSDISFNIPEMREALAKVSEGADVYFYLYDFIAPELQRELFEGAGHGTEFFNFIGSFPNFPSPNWANPDVAKVQKIFVDLFVSFAKTGIPTSDGITVAKVTSVSKLPYLKINVDSKVEENLWPDRLQFWNSMAKEFGFDWPEFQHAAVARDEL